MPAPSFVAFKTARPSAIVVSHERSGTHFLMNSLARSYGYVARPWVNLDLTHYPINYHAPWELARVLTAHGSKHIANVVKTHHAAEFFAPILPDLQRDFVLFYIHRHPVEVMISFWRFINRWQWHEGPRRGDPALFALAEPEGQLMRYQMHQRASMLDRWARHVEGWLELAEGQPRIVAVRFDDLRDRYAETVAGFAGVLEAPPQDLTPAPQSDYIVGTSDPYSDGHRAALEAAAREAAGETMQRLGYA